MARITILTCLIVVSIFAPQSAIAETNLQKGVRQYSARQFDQAVNTLTIAAHEDPKNAEVHYNLGNALLQTGDAVKATREYELGYALSGSGPIAAYCSTALAGIRQRNHNSRTSTTYYRTTTNGVSRTAIRCPVGTESHRDGVEKSHGGLSAEEWSVWRVYYDKAFRRLEMKVILAMVPNWQSMTGISELYYYVDRNRKLRARVSRSTTDDAVNAALLEVVRNLDGSAAIEFPATIKADSFNFYHGVDLGEVALALRHQARSTSTTATMTNTNATLQQTGQAAAQGKLQIPPASTAVSATLQNSKVTADVAGKVIGRNSTELKAVQEILPPETASQSVKGQVLMEPAIPPEQKSGDQQSGKAAPEKSGDQQNGKAAPEKSGDQQSGDALPEKSGDQQRVKAAP